MLAAAEQHGPHREAQLIDETGLKILADRRHAPAHAHVAPARGGACLLERGMDTVGDEEKLGAACHLECRPRMMGEHEHRCVIGRLLAPPALPTLIRPRPAHRTEHVASEDPGTDALEALRGERIVDSALAALLAVHPPPCARREEPLHELGPPDAKRILQILPRTGAEAIDGKGKASDTDSGHVLLLQCTPLSTYPARATPCKAGQPAALRSLTQLAEGRGLRGCTRRGSARLSPAR